MRNGIRALVLGAVVLVALVAVGSGDDAAPARFRPSMPRRTAPPPKAHFISPARQDVSDFQLSGNSRGDATLLWREYARFGHTRLWVRTKRGGGSFGRPRALSGVHVSAVDALSAVGEDGTQIVSWSELGRGETRMKVAVRRGNGSFAERTLSAHRTPASTIYLGEASDLAVAPDGTAVLVAVGFVGRTSQVLALVRDAKGHWSKPQVVTTGRHGVRYPVVAFDAAGTATLAWERGPREFPDDGAPPVKQEIRVAVRPPGGRFGKPQRVSKPGHDARDAFLAVNGRGDAALMWNSTHGRNLPGSRVGIAIRKAGGRFGAPRLITPPGEARLPQAALGPTGSLVAVWSEDRRLVAARGSIAHGLGPPVQIAPRTAESGTIAADRAGNAFAVWVRYPGRAFTSEVGGRFTGADGSLGAPLRLAPRGSHDYPQALLYPDGSALAAWTRLRHASNRIEAVRVRP
jgi:hypothetical protein